CLFLFVCFFFSSRRRHTRSKRDWSSDVCSSDLDALLGRGPYDWTVGNLGSANTALPYHAGLAQHAPKRLRHRLHFQDMLLSLSRSEERRVGKECRFPS